MLVIVHCVFSMKLLLISTNISSKALFQYSVNQFRDVNQFLNTSLQV